MFQYDRYYSSSNFKYVFFVTKCGQEDKFVFMDNLEQTPLIKGSPLYESLRQTALPIGNPLIRKIIENDKLIPVSQIVQREYYYVPVIQQIIFSIGEVDNYRDIIRSVFQLHRFILRDFEHLNCFKLPSPTF